MQQRSVYGPGAHGSLSSGATHPQDLIRGAGGRGQGPNKVVEIVDIAGTVYIQYRLEDQLGNLIAMLDASAYRLQEYRYSDYGEAFAHFANARFQEN